MKTVVHWVIVAGVGLVTAPWLHAAEDTPKQSAAKQPAGHPFLGVYVSSVHPALAGHLRDLLSPEQGLIVEDLGENSPAAKAGIKVHDILTTYDDQKLFSAEQLAKLVHSDKVGREVAVGYLRDGKLQKAQVKLGEAEMPQPPAWMPFGEGPPHRFGGRGPMLRRFRAGQTVAPEWENFDSLTLKKLADNKFRAEVQYLDKDGKTRKHAFEGTREEIRTDIDAEKDLKPAERAHLLRSLGLMGRGDEVPFPNIWFGPSPAWYFEPSDTGL